MRWGRRRTTANLEQKLDGLISMISTNSGGVGAAAGSSTPNFNVPQSDVNPNQNQNKNLSQSQGQGHVQNQTSKAAAPQPLPVTATTSASSLTTPAPDITSEEAEQCLDTFRTHMLRYFPLVHMPDNMTARELYGVRPFLWYCIMAISCKSTAKQVALSETVRRTIAQGIIMDHNRNIDLLLGLLVFVGWYVFSIPGNGLCGLADNSARLRFQIHSKPFATLYVQLALSMVYDLGLNRDVPKEQPVFQTTVGTREQPWVGPVRTMEERRAVLGCYYITSV